MKGEKVMKKAAIMTILFAGICLLSACGAEPETESTGASSAAVITSAASESGSGAAVKATTKARKKTNSNASNGSGVALTAKVPEVEITGVSLTHSSENPITLDLDEKTGPFAAHVDASGYVGKDRIRIYTEDETLVEVSDVEVKSGGLVNFYLTGKNADKGNLYIATADGTLISDPVELVVRSAEEKAYAEQAVYYSALGDYWHFSEECAKSDGPDTFYNYKGEELPKGSADLPVVQTTRENLFGVRDRTPCPKCAAEETAQQDGE